MPTRSEAVAWGVAPASAGQVWYTVPAGQTFILKSVAVSQKDTQTAFGTIYVIDGAGLALVGILDLALETTTHQLLELWVVMPAGAQLVASISGHPITYWVSGALLP